MSGASDACALKLADQINVLLFLFLSISSELVNNVSLAHKALTLSR